MTTRLPELFAYLGLDELGTGEIGLKQSSVPAGFIPMVAVKQEKMDRNSIRASMELQALAYGKKIYFCRYVFSGVLWTTRNGMRWDD